MCDAFFTKKIGPAVATIIESAVDLLHHRYMANTGVADKMVLSLSQINGEPNISTGSGIFSMIF
jgi:hypothetical protein